ncbi:MAG TPA: flagellin [Steroidobacteraceae bacterium]|nr:flagellin [Steroidobacteraceae bacterium]
MSLVLNTNIDALVAQNSLTTSGSQLAMALQQLSSGLRINTAADDAAGYAIAQGMTSQVNGLNQAAQNANGGVSLAQTASGAMQEVTNDLQTMRDLAVESLNATNSSQDRTDLNAQFQQLMNDINSVASQTQFNGVNLLDGSFQGATFQVGANAGQSITIGAISSASASKIGNYFTGALSSGGTGGVYSATDLATSAGLGTTVDGASVTLTVTADGTAYTTSAITLSGDAATDLKSVAAAVNQALSPVGGIVATVNGTTGITLSSTAAHTVTFAVASATDSSGNAIASPGANTLKDLGLDTSDTIATTGTAKYLSGLDVKTVDNSNLTLISIDNALQQIATSSANLGAYQNRFQAAITGLNTDATNLSAAKSSIVDADYAQATSNLSKAQILQQASTAMVAQANMIPQNILSLLQKLP